MSYPTKPRTHPFRLLLYLEWILLGITVLGVFTISITKPLHNRVPQLELLTILSVSILLGMMGLWLPTGKLLSKLLYTGVSFALIFLPVFTSEQGIPVPARFLILPLLLIIVLRSCLLFGLSGRLTVAGLVFGAFLIVLFLPERNIYDFPEPPLRGSRLLFTPKKLPISLPLQSLTEYQARLMVLNLTLNAVLVALLFGLMLVFVLLSINALLAERQSREQLMLANQQLRRYAQRIEDQATLQERNRIAREIHDSLGHSLTAQSIQLENALVFRQSNAQKAQEFLLEAKRLGSNALQEVHQSIDALSSNPLQEQSLESAILSLINDFHRTTGTMPDCKISLSLPVPTEVSTAVYRIVKEALTNIYKHGKATKVTVCLQTTARSLSLLVKDNGKGFNIEQNTVGFGLQGMRERAVALGGQFNITSTVGVGCQIAVDVPLSSLSPIIRLS